MIQPRKSSAMMTRDALFCPSNFGGWFRLPAASSPQQPDTFSFSSHIWLGLSGRTKLRHTQEFWENESEKQEFLTEICQHSNSNPNSVARHECQSPKNWEESSKKWEESPNCYWEEYSKFVGNLQKVWGIAKMIVDS